MIEPTVTLPLSEATALLSLAEKGAEMMDEFMQSNEAHQLSPDQLYMLAHMLISARRGIHTIVSALGPVSTHHTQH